MTQSWKSNQELRANAKAFFEAASEAYCDDDDEITETIEQGKGLRVEDGLAFKPTEEVLSAEKTTIDKCAKLLGTKKGSSEEISVILWGRLVQTMRVGGTDFNIDTLVSDFVEAVDTHAKQKFRLVVPNFAILFDGDVHEITIGPVQAIRSTNLLSSSLSGIRGPNWEVIAGNEFETTYTAGSFSFQLSPVSWWVEAEAAKQHMEEEGIWLINIAISLLRFSYPNGSYLFFPRLGETETKPNIASTGRSQKLIRTPTGVSGGGFRTPSRYLVDQSISGITQTREFMDRAQLIFDAPNKSVAARVAKGLGWLSRGRQSAERSERFLFFFTAIEALLTSNDSNSPVTQTIARYAAVILHQSNADRAKLAKRLGGLYTLRSQLVHGGTRGISMADVDELQDIAEEIYFAMLNTRSLACKDKELEESLKKASYGLPWEAPSA